MTPPVPKIYTKDLKSTGVIRPDCRERRSDARRLFSWAAAKATPYGMAVEDAIALAGHA